MSLQKFIMGPDGTLLKVNDNGSINVEQANSFYRLSTEPMPTEADGVKDGSDLLLLDTKQVFVYYKGQWREI